MDEETRNELLGLTVDIVAAHVANNRVATNEVSELISQVHSALVDLAQPKTAEQSAPEPAVPVRSSVKHDYIVCLEDGKKLKMLRRYLRTNYNMTPEEYRTKWGLPRDYPMVAPAYAEQRRGLAQKIGLGRKRAAEPVPAPVAKRGRKPAAAKTVPVEAAAAEEAPAAAEPKRRGPPTQGHCAGRGLRTGRDDERGRSPRHGQACRRRSGDRRGSRRHDRRARHRQHRRIRDRGAGSPRRAGPRRDRGGDLARHRARGSGGGDRGARLRRGRACRSDDRRRRRGRPVVPSDQGCRGRACSARRSSRVPRPG